MAKLPIEESETIWTLKRQLLEIVNTATAAEDALFSNYGETELNRSARRVKTSFRAIHTLVFPPIKSTGSDRRVPT